ncbi:MAG: acetyl-CoA carboxylase carboxyltransferase subunit beta [Vampirovibrionales bacterium]|nr:acetyl-CoA carboxylase carboxyltransferase subunit beta [Vampirovibrionales bacterium]
MPLTDWFAAKRKQGRLDAKAVNSKLSDEELTRLWVNCFSCSASIPRKEWVANRMVCPHCDYHFRIGARERIAQLTVGEGDSFEEMDADLRPGDPLGFEDTRAYRDRQKEAQTQSELNDAVVTGMAVLDGERMAIGIMDFAYMGGSMGSVVGEKITRLAEAALRERVGMIVFCASGGARMQEGTFSLMQMVKTGAALARLHESRLLYVSILTEPTFGGVTASFGTLGDFVLAEKDSRIGFAGRRVIEQTIRQKLPADFQTADYLLKFGQVDQVVSRAEMRDLLIRLIRLHRVSLSPDLAWARDTGRPVGVSSGL